MMPRPLLTSKFHPIEQSSSSTINATWGKKVEQNERLMSLSSRGKEALLQNLFDDNSKRESIKKKILVHSKTSMSNMKHKSIPSHLFRSHHVQQKQSSSRFNRSNSYVVKHTALSEGALQMLSEL